MCKQDIRIARGSEARTATATGAGVITKPLFPNDPDRLTLTVMMRTELGAGAPVIAVVEVNVGGTWAAVGTFTTAVGMLILTYRELGPAISYEVRLNHLVAGAFSYDAVATRLTVPLDTL